MRLVMLGAGAIGGVVAGHLARAGREVLVLARGEQLAALRERGLRVETPDGAFEVHPEVQASSEPIAWRDDDVLVACTKVHDLAVALREVDAPPRVPIVCMTNGLEGERIALRHARDVIGGCVFMPATFLVPGTVQVWATPPGLFDLGRYPDGTGDHTDAIAGELVAAGFDCEVRPNVMKWKRGKLLSNLMNGAEALAGPSVRASELGARARAEGRAVYAAANLSCTTEAEDTERRKAITNREIAGAKRAGGSTWQSLARGHSTLEVDYLNGEIVMLGRINGVPTPVNEALQRIVSDEARRGAKPGAMTLDELTSRVDRERG